VIATLITFVVAFFVSGYAVNNARAIALWQRLQQSVSPTMGIAIAALIYSVALGSVAILRHWSLNSNALDLGLMDQIVWNSTQGRWFEESFIAGHPMSFLGHHFSPALALLVPFYWLLPGPETLIVLQIGCIVGSAILLYRVGAKLTKRVWVATALAWMVLLHPLVHDAALFDFHQDAIGMFFLALGLFGVTYRRWGIAAVGWLISLLAKEEIAIYWIAIGAFLLLVEGKRRWHKVLFVLLNVLWLYAVITLLIPLFQSKGEVGFSFFERYATWGSSIGDVFSTISIKTVFVIQNLLLPSRVSGLAMMVLPVLLFLVRSRWSVLILLMPLGINTFSDLVGQHNYRFHYSLLPMVMIVYACSWAIVFMNRPVGDAPHGVPSGVSVHAERASSTRAIPDKFPHLYLKRATLFLGVASVMLFMGVSQMGVQLYSVMQDYLPSDHDQVGYRLMWMIPPQASVIAQNKLVAHLSQRRYITILSRSLAEPADYYLIDLQSPTSPQTLNKYVAEVIALLENADYGVVHLEDGYILLAQGASRQEMDVAAAMRMVEQFLR